jgi:hypothetical protein
MRHPLMLVSVVSVVAERSAETESTGSVHKQTTDESRAPPRGNDWGATPSTTHRKMQARWTAKQKMTHTDLDTRFTKAFHQTRGCR